jgi:hypothetical protein
VSDDQYVVTKRTILQITPVCGVRAAYMEDDGTMITNPIIALALCESTDELREKGKLIRSGEPYREVCGLESFVEGIDFCEDMSNFVRYLAPGEEMPT